jgi:uncharacterized protein
VRVILDTNAVVSGLLWAGRPREIIALIEQEKITLCTSPALVDELREVVGRSKFHERLAKINSTEDDVIGRYLRFSEVISVPAQVQSVVTNDPDDDHVLACALAANVDFIVSGDRHLLELSRYQGIPIVNAADFLTAYHAASTRTH